MTEKRLTVADLKVFSFLGELPVFDRNCLLKHLTTETYLSGAWICLQDKGKDTFFFLKQGKVDVFASLPDQRYFHLTRLGDGDVFGQNIFVQNTLSPLAIQAKSKVLVFCLSRYVHEWALKRAERWAIQMQRQACIGFTQQLRNALGQITEIIGEKISNKTPSADEQETNQAEEASESIDASLLQEEQPDPKVIQQLLSLLVDTGTLHIETKDSSLGETPPTA